MKLFAALAVLLLAGCANQPITLAVPEAGERPAPPLLFKPSEGLIAQLEIIRLNFDDAIASGLMDVNDVHNQCLHRFLVRAGVEQEPGASPPKSITLRPGGVLVSGGNAHILRLWEKKYGARTATISPECRALIGDWTAEGVEALADRANESTTAKVIRFIAR